jgi:hypothetical protein
VGAEQTVIVVRAELEGKGNEVIEDELEMRKRGFFFKVWKERRMS